MVALKGPAVAGFLTKPDRNVVLVYGPDSGLVGERAQMILASVDTAGDPFASVVIDGDALASDPGRLAEEAWTVPLFGGKRSIRVTQTSRNIAAAVQPLVAEPPADAVVVVEGSDLKPSSPLRKLFDGAKAAVSIPCYADDGGALDRLIDKEIGRLSLSISPDARALVKGLIGGDRLASRQELSKLALYCAERGQIDVEDVTAICGDASAFALDEILDAVGTGETGTAERALSRAFAAGQSAGAVVSALSRHFLQIAEARARIDRGETADAAMRSLRPPVFFKRQNAFRRQVASWRADAIPRALDMIAAAELETRRRADIAEAITSRLALSLSTTARRNR